MEETEFSKAWKSFRDNNRGTFDDGILRRSEGMQYLENRLHLAFSAGWNSVMIEKRFAGQTELKHE